MSKYKRKDQTEKNLESISEALSTSEQFLEKNQKKLLLGLLFIVIIVVAYIGYNKLYAAPNKEKAEAAIFQGELYFQNNQDSLAIFGDGNGYIGFEKIISEYSGTKTSNLAKAYAGICYSRLGNNEKALEKLTAFKGSDIFVSPAITGIIGDVYINMGKTNEGIEKYIAAADMAKDNMLTPMFLKKAGIVYISTKQFDKAIDIFKKIKENNINSPEASEADKYIKIAMMQNK